MTGIFLLHAFKDVNFSLADLPKFSKAKNATATVNGDSVKYTKFERQQSNKRIEDLKKTEEKIRMYDGSEEDITVLLIESYEPDAKNGTAKR